MYEIVDHDVACSRCIYPRFREPQAFRVGNAPDRDQKRLSRDESVLALVLDSKFHALTDLFQKCQRTTKTGTGLRARTSVVWLPSRRRPRPRRPWDAIAIRLQCFARAVSMIASAGTASGM